MKVGNPIGNISVKDLETINYFEIINELCKRNLSLMAHNYLFNLTEFQFVKDKSPGLQRFIITRIFIRSLIMANAIVSLPHLDKILTEIDVENSNMIWLDKIQTRVIPYCNEYKVFNLLSEQFN